MIFMASSTSCALRSAIFISAISLSWFFVIEATFSRFGSPDPLSSFKAFLISVDAGGNIQFAASGGFVEYGVTTGITAAGSTQGTATTLTRPINVVSTVASGAGIILPTVPAGARIIIVNTSENALNVYPPSGAVINSGSTNAAYSQPAGARLEYFSVSTTQWYTLNATYG